MNILPKKSWHVRTKKNIDKVRKDEAKAAEEERLNQARIALADQEARTDLLRSRAHGTNGGGQFAKSDFAVQELFADLNQGKADKRHNVEREREAKLEQEKWEKKIGLLQCLTDGSEDKPWYIASHRERMKLDEKKEEASTSGMKNKIVTNYQCDPLNTMQMYLDQMKSTRSDVKRATSSNHTSTVSKPEEERKHRLRKRHEERREKRRHRSRSPLAKSSSSSVGSTTTVNSKLEQLRAERLKREKLERDRTNELLKSKRGRDDKIEDDRSRNYNSQFNPHLSRH